MSDQPPEQRDLCTGVRVRRRTPGQPDRIGMVVAGLDDFVPGLAKSQVFVEVLPEASATSRPESWPLSQLSLLPVAEQLPKFGGCFCPPKGYPLRTRST